jgi:hypothetical protein
LMQTNTNFSGLGIRDPFALASVASSMPGSRRNA